MIRSFLLMHIQPIQSLEHATNGVVVPTRKATRDEIINMFKAQLTKLKEHLNVRNSLSNFLSFHSCLAESHCEGTCQFDLAGIKRRCIFRCYRSLDRRRFPSPVTWEFWSALFGFTKLNNVHNGKRLGGALFKIVERLGIAHKVFKNINGTRCILIRADQLCHLW